mmetsp:Transcript_42794/g.54992  ORF Transcript_42794/g.54992 Transcript_42794/m.54992 type:complete len:309 (+) Transcript_42794:1436-2362(+)
MTGYGSNAPYLRIRRYIMFSSMFTQGILIFAGFYAMFTETILKKNEGCRIFISIILGFLSCLHIPLSDGSSYYHQQHRQHHHHHYLHKYRHQSIYSSSRSEPFLQQQNSLSSSSSQSSLSPSLSSLSPSLSPRHQYQYQYPIFIWILSFIIIIGELCSALMSVLLITEFIHETELHHHIKNDFSITIFIILFLLWTVISKVIVGILGNRLNDIINIVKDGSNLTHIFEQRSWLNSFCLFIAILISGGTCYALYGIFQQSIHELHHLIFHDLLKNNNQQNGFPISVNYFFTFLFSTLCISTFSIVGNGL